MKRIISVILISLASIISINITLAYYCSADNIENMIKTQSYNIKLDLDGGTISPSNNLVVKNNKVILPSIEKKGFIFLGYSLSENGKVEYNANDKVDISSINNNTLFAKYEANNEKINAIEKILSLAETDTDNIIRDDNTQDHNIRYYGKNPNNYIKFSPDDTDIWRIVGVFNNVEDKNGDKGTRIKLVREVSIGQLSWDDDEVQVSNGFGLNEWSDADLMKLLNPGYEDYSDSTYTTCEYDYDLGESVCNLKSEKEKVNNSIWWNNQKGLCYYSARHRVKECDFSIGEEKGPSDSAKNMIDDVVWNLGGANQYYYDDEFGTASHFYSDERNDKVYDCSDSDKRKCPRTTKWTGKVALIYPSDYGYATAGGNNVNRQQCLSITLNHWGVYDNEDCVDFNYLYKPTRWFLSPAQNDKSNVMSGAYKGYVATAPASFNDYVYPSVFLKQNVLIASGDGTSDNPYILDIN